MFLGKLYRKKRTLLLPTLPTPKKKLLMSWSRPVQDAPSLERYWFQGMVQCHNAFCGCGNAGTHFSALAHRYGYPQVQHQHLLRSPSSVRSPNNIRRARALPAAPEPQQALPWHGGGGEGDAARGGDAGAGRDEPEYEPGDLDALFAAVEEE